MPQRIEQIKKWLEPKFGQIKSFDVASADASFRRYFRVVFSTTHQNNLHPSQTYIVMDAPPEQENIQPFINISNYLEDQNLNVPHIYAQNSEQGFLLLADLGNQNYLDIINSNNADALYNDAIQSLLHLYKSKPKQQIDLPEYNQELLIKEMDLFEQWYINGHLKKSLDHKQKLVLQQTINYISKQVLQQPKVFVHRDYHCRNLMFNSNNNPGIIDFQDAVMGPITYDLVSLLRDSYIHWPEDKVQQWVNTFYQQLVSLQLISNCSFKQFMRWFDVMGMQRQIKVLGIFARLHHRDGKENYLKDIPLTYKNLVESSCRYKEFEEFSRLLKLLK